MQVPLYTHYRGASALLTSSVFCRELSNDGLGGYLPWDDTIWSSLKSLSSVDLSSNSIAGYIPPQIVEGLGLQTLELANNSLQGPLPSAMANGLQIMDASVNQLTGVQNFFIWEVLAYPDVDHCHDSAISRTVSCCWQAYAVICFSGSSCAMSVKSHARVSFLLSAQ